MANVGLILLVFAFVLVAISSRIGVAGPWDIFKIGIACWIASELIGGVARSGLLH
jgi:hypothetical protein